MTERLSRLILGAVVPVVSAFFDSVVEDVVTAVVDDVVEVVLGAVVEVVLGAVDVVATVLISFSGV